MTKEFIEARIREAKHEARRNESMSSYNQEPLASCLLNMAANYQQLADYLSQHPAMQEGEKVTACSHPFSKNGFCLTCGECICSTLIPTDDEQPEWTTAVIDAPQPRRTDTDFGTHSMNC